MINKEILARGQNFNNAYMEGTKYIYVQKHKDWLTFVHKIFEQNNGEKLSQDMVAVLKELKENHNFDTINETIKKHYDGEEYNLIMYAVVTFANNGPEFYESTHSKIDSEFSHYLSKMKQNNLIYKEEVSGKVVRPEPSSLFVEPEEEMNR